MSWLMIALRMAPDEDYLFNIPISRRSGACAASASMARDAWSHLGALEVNSVTHLSLFSPSLTTGPTVVVLIAGSK